jgi:hypothetical protein
LLGVLGLLVACDLNRLVFNRHVGSGRPGFPEAREALAGQKRAGTGIRASHSERGRRPRATSKHEDQRGRAGSRSERSEEGTSTHHGDPRAGLSCPSDQFTPRNIRLLAGYDHSHLFNSGHGHRPWLPAAVARKHGVTPPEEAKTPSGATAASPRTSRTQATAFATVLVHYVLNPS